MGRIMRQLLREFGAEPDATTDAGIVPQGGL
jgi:hypothetical protein